MSSNIKFNIVYDDGDPSSVTCFVGSNTYVATVGQTHFVPAVQALQAGTVSTEDEVKALFDVGEAIQGKFKRLSDRVTISGGSIFFDGDPVHSVLADTIVLFHAQGNEHFGPLVAFMEKLETNPNAHSRAMLFDWLARRSFGLTDTGDFIGYKGVARVGGGYLSYSSGNATVNGEPFRNKRIPMDIGSIVEMPRSEVAHNPADACSTGLHVGDFDFARTFRGGAIVAVLVNPRDVVSVPTDAGGAKMRVRRYVAIAEVTAPYPDLLVVNDERRILATNATPVARETKVIRPPKARAATADRLAAARKRDAEQAAAQPKGPRITGRGKAAGAAPEKEATTEASRPVRVVAPATGTKRKGAARKEPSYVSDPDAVEAARKARVKSSTRKAAVSKAAAKKAPATRKPAVVKPPKHYEDFKRINFEGVKYVTLRWLAKEWAVKGLPANPTTAALVDALVKYAPRRRAQLAKKTKGYTNTKTR